MYKIMGFPFPKKYYYHLLLVLLVLFASVFIVSLGEVYFRFFSRAGYTTPEIIKNQSLQYVPSIFSRHVFPQKELTVNGWDSSKWYISEKGYRGPDFSVKKPRGTIRIIFYGGSSTFNSGAPQGKDWPHRVGQILKAKVFQKIEVINAGIPGHASFESVGRLFSEGHIFNPDYVVLYNAWNDIKYFREEETLLRIFKPILNSDNPFLDYQNSIDRFLSETSQLYVRIRYIYYSWKYPIGKEGIKPTGEYSNTLSKLGLKQYQLNIEMFVDLARNIGATPILMTQARLVNMNNTKSQKARIVYEYQLLTHEALCLAFNKTDKIIREVANRKGTVLIDASKYLTGNNAYFRDHIHLTNKGSEELSRIVADQIADELSGNKR